MQSYPLFRSKLHILKNLDELSSELAETIVRIAVSAVNNRGKFTLALSGGSTPSSLYSKLAESKYSDRMPWQSTYIFWGDERCVSHDNADSNYRMARQSFLDKIDIPESNIFATTGQDKNPAEAAAGYAKTLVEFFGLSEHSQPSFDLILLGLGPEGHTASIFPGSPVLNASDKLVMSVWVESKNADRITFTLPVINAARHVIFMVSGAGKKQILPEVIRLSEKENVRLPAQYINPVAGALEWYVDEAAASELNWQKLKGLVG